MARPERSRPFFGFFFFAGVLTLAGYFGFAAIQGEFGLFAQVQLEAERDILRADLDALTADVEELRNKTRRLSDTFLDLDLLDERARNVLGLVRPDEIVIQ